MAPADNEPARPRKGWPPKVKRSVLMAFLTARWEHLVLLNYVCPPELLEPLVPAGTELDTWEGHTLVSLVGFLFSDTRLLGIPVPFHRTFEEVNLRFYVRRPPPDHRRAVVFIRELVPRWAIAAVARGVYNEPYLALPMRHRRSLTADGGVVSYGWTWRGADFELGARVSGVAAPLQMCVHRGAAVTAVGGTRNLELLGSLGAKRTIDYERAALTSCF